MKVKTLNEMIAELGSQKAVAERFEVPPQYLTRWLKMGVIFVDGKPFKPVVEIKRL